MNATRADESFHAPGSADPAWTETAWFAFAVPERRITGALYPFFRPNLGVAACGIYVWDDRSELAIEALYARSFWHELPPAGDLLALELACGLEYECIDPLQCWNLRYRDGDALTLDLAFEALGPAHFLGSPARGHFDQPGRVTGTLVLGGERIDVDCIEMRDRSWGPRPDTGSVRAGYAYATASAEHGFHVITFGAGEIAVGGYLLRDGVRSDVVEGRRHVIRERGRPLRTRVELKDREGRTLAADAALVNRFGMQASPNHFAWMCGALWSFDGITAWGEDQDVWSPDLLAAALRAP